MQTILELNDRRVAGSPITVCDVSNCYINYYYLANWLFIVLIGFNKKLAMLPDYGVRCEYLLEWLYRITGWIQEIVRSNLRKAAD